MPKASCWSWDAFGIPLPLGGRFRGREGDDLDNAKNQGVDLFVWGATEVMRVET